MNLRTIVMLGCLVGLVAAAHATLVIKPEPVQVTGQTAIVKLELKNTFTNAVESARAAVFVSDENGKVVGQATRWIVGGTADRPALEPDKETAFHFVVPLSGEFSTNLQVRILPSRLIFKGGRMGNPAKDFQIVQ